MGGGPAAGCGRPRARASRGKFRRASCWKGSLKGSMAQAGPVPSLGRRIEKKKAAESPSGPGEDLAWSPGCDRHMAVQGRLNIVEETVEKTVEHLEAEVTGLLGLLEELASNLPPGPFSPKPDLLGDDGF
ncbi:placenta-specific protein 9 isoform X1 [Rattus norvegicus]|uniref:Placenta associated 9 n=1 Tax=Rattus norvegicus TaxID=10116 RepID=A0A8I6AT08_RAT|nr:placenta-specific protein 9 isoform X1 [Rattus norvegicus]